MNITGPKIYFTIPIFGGINVTQTMLTSAVVTLLLCVLGVLLGRNLKKRPGRMQVMVEKGVSVIRGMVSDAMGPHNVRWTPYIATLFLSSLFGTFLGMTGILRSTTADLSTTMTWALMTSAICWYQSIKNYGFGSWLKGFTEPIAVMTPMNIVSEIAQPVSLAFRHFGNIAGGGVITTLLYTSLSGASVLALRAIASSGIAVALTLTALGVLLLLLKYKNKKARVALRFVGAISVGLGLLGLLSVLGEWIGLPYPVLPGWLYGLLYFLCLGLLLFAVVLLLWQKRAWFKPLGLALLAVSLLGVVYISGGPLNVPVLTVGIPAVLSLYFDVFSGVIQAFVFSLLSMIYISGNCPPPEECRQRKQKKQAKQDEASETAS